MRLEEIRSFSLKMMPHPINPQIIPTIPKKPIRSIFAIQESKATNIGSKLAIMTARKASIFFIAAKLSPK